MDARAVDWPGLLAMLPLLSKSTIEEEIRQGRFPKQRQFPGGSSAWLVSDIEDWLKGTPVKLPQPPRTEATQLYRHFDGDGRLLYVGISLSAIGRLSTHICGSHWADEIVTVTIQRFPTRSEAMDAERAAIQAEKPLHNITHAEPRC